MLWGQLYHPLAISNSPANYTFLTSLSWLQWSKYFFLVFFKFVCFFCLPFYPWRKSNWIWNSAENAVDTSVKKSQKVKVPLLYPKGHKIFPPHLTPTLLEQRAAALPCWGIPWWSSPPSQPLMMSAKQWGDRYHFYRLCCDRVRHQNHNLAVLRSTIYR